MFKSGSSSWQVQFLRKLISRVHPVWTFYHGKCFSCKTLRSLLIIYASHFMADGHYQDNALGVILSKILFPRNICTPLTCSIELSFKLSLNYDYFGELEGLSVGHLNTFLHRHSPNLFFFFACNRNSFNTYIRININHVNFTFL